METVKERLESTDSAACEMVKKIVIDEPDEEPPDEESKRRGVGTNIKISSLLFILLYDCVGLQLHANEQIQASSISDVEVSWTEMNLLVGNLTMDFTTRSVQQ